MRFRNKLVDYLCDWVMGSSYHLNLTSPSGYAANTSANASGPSSGANATISAQSTNNPASVGVGSAGINLTNVCTLSTNLGPGCNIVFSGPNAGTLGLGQAITSNTGVTATPLIGIPVNVASVGAVGSSQIPSQGDASSTIVSCSILGEHPNLGSTVPLSNPLSAAHGPTATVTSTSTPGFVLLLNSVAACGSVPVDATATHSSVSPGITGSLSGAAQTGANNVAFGGTQSTASGTNTGQLIGLSSAVGNMGKLHTLPLLAGSIVGPSIGHLNALCHVQAGSLSNSSGTCSTQPTTVQTLTSGTGSDMGPGSSGNLIPPSGVSTVNACQTQPCGSVYGAGIAGGVTPTAGIATQSVMQTRELDLACMEAVAALLQGMPLQPEEAERGDLMDAKSHLFAK